MSSREGCPRPDKIAFATQNTADRRAHFLSLCADSDTAFWAYACVCGWWHLTTRLPPLDTRTGRDVQEPE
jgi:hypothetical protein